MTDAEWSREHVVGAAATFHARDLPDPPRRATWWFEVDRPALVLGSTQSDALVDLDRAAAAGVEVARRRSGGGAVWLQPGAVTWVDVVIPASDPLWVADVGRSTGWLGRAWAGVLEDLGVPGAVAHPGPIDRSRWSGWVCFAGLGPGEVTVGGRKVVGISQRRTRAGARFQCAVLHRWDPRPMVELLRLDALDRAALTGALDNPTAPIGLDDLGARVAPADLVAGLHRRLP